MDKEQIDFINKISANLIEACKEITSEIKTKKLILEPVFSVSGNLQYISASDEYHQFCERICSGATESRKLQKILGFKEEYLIDVNFINNSDFQNAFLQSILDSQSQKSPSKKKLKR